MCIRDRPQIEEWQQRPLSAVYPIVFIDAIHFSVRDEHIVKKIAAYIILGVNDEGKTVSYTHLDVYKRQQQLVKIVNEELTQMIGGEVSRLEFSQKPPTVIMTVSYTHLVCRKIPCVLPLFQTACAYA